MSDSEYNSKIEKIASLIIHDNISVDEQVTKKLQKYYDFVKTNFNLEGEEGIEIVNDAFLYLKLKNSSDVDPLQDGDKFGVGFS